MQVKNSKYEIRTDRSKNRLYLTIIGFWANPGEVSNYVSDLENATRDLRSGFTIVTDIGRMKPPPQDVMPLHEAAQKTLIKAGLSRTAEVSLDASKIKKMTVDQISKKSGMVKEVFGTFEEAESWLDSQ
jgi:hypothetical protein